jgi:hypothetical protein
MGQLGISVMINEIFGYATNLTAELWEKSHSLTITEIKKVKEDVPNAERSWRSYNGDSLRITFEDGSKLYLYDDGQSCCEHRYMTIDDDLDKISGVTIKEIRIENGPKVEEACSEEHEQQFVKIDFSDGTGITMTTHNEHNGYYGGFSLTPYYVAPEQVA